MHYYKFISNNTIIDAVCNPSWVKTDRRGRVVLCDISEAMGVVSSDSQRIMQIAGADLLKNGEYEEIYVADITETEYDELTVLLNLNATIPNDDEVIWDEEPPAIEEPIVDATLAEVKARCLSILSADCQKAIYAGVDIALSDGVVRHFDLELEDQLNLLSISALITSGALSIPYHASGELCEFYSASDMMKIIDEANKHRTYHTSYYNSLKNWVMSMDSIADVGNVHYGDTIPVEYCSYVLLDLLGA